MSVQVHFSGNKRAGQSTGHTLKLKARFQKAQWKRLSTSPLSLVVKLGRRGAARRSCKNSAQPPPPSPGGEMSGYQSHLVGNQSASAMPQRKRDASALERHKTLPQLLRQPSVQVAVIWRAGCSLRIRNVRRLASYAETGRRHTTLCCS